MKLTYSYITKLGYFIRISNLTADDHKIAEYLDISYEEYKNILEQNHAIYHEESYKYKDGHFFQTILDIEKVIETLESILIMNKLTE